MKKFVGMLVLCLLPLGAQAQNAWHAGDPARVPRVSDTLSAMTPEDMIETMRKGNIQMISSRLEAYSDPETIRLIAKFSYDLFEALIEQGFTEEQALEVVKSIGLPIRQ